MMTHVLGDLSGGRHFLKMLNPENLADDVIVKDLIEKQKHLEWINSYLKISESHN